MGRRSGGAVSEKLKRHRARRRSATAAAKSMASSGVAATGAEIEVAHAGVDVRADVVGDLVGRAVRRVALEAVERQSGRATPSSRRADRSDGPTPHQKCSPWFQSTSSRPASAAICSTSTTDSRYRSARHEQAEPAVAETRGAPERRVDRPPITIGTGTDGVGRIVPARPGRCGRRSRPTSPARSARTIVRRLVEASPAGRGIDTAHFELVTILTAEPDTEHEPTGCELRDRS